jgi:hypothetical protein
LSVNKPFLLIISDIYNEIDIETQYL